MQVASGRPTMTAARMLAVLSLTAAMLIPLAGNAHAACHAFTVEVDPATPSEGQTVTVTIRRDADVQPSSVRVRTVDGSATGGDDYTPLDERVEFEDGTERTREVDIIDDDATEDDETFDIELSEGQGCEVNQNFSYGSATVTIQANDAAQEQPTEEETPTEASSPAEQETTSEDQTPAAQETTEAEATSEELPETGSDGALLILGVLGLLAGGAVLRRTARPGA